MIIYSKNKLVKRIFGIPSSNRANAIRLYTDPLDFNVLLKCQVIIYILNINYFFSINPTPEHDE